MGTNTSRPRLGDYNPTARNLPAHKKVNNKQDCREKGGETDTREL